MATVYPKYDKDVYGWAIHTAQLLKDGKMDEVDLENIIEEVETLGRNEKHELLNRLSVLISHLLKWQYKPTMRGHTLKYSIIEARKKSEIQYRDNPSLKDELDEVLMDAYDLAIILAARDTGLYDNVFPKECPYTFEEIMNDAFYPESDNN